MKIPNATTFESKRKSNKIRLSWKLLVMKIRNVRAAEEWKSWSELLECKKRKEIQITYNR